MFDFRIIDTVDGNQIIDRRLKTSYNVLTPIQMLEYMEMDSQLTIMDHIKRKTRRGATRKQRLAKIHCGKLLVSVELFNQKWN